MDRAFEKQLFVNNATFLFWRQKIIFGLFLSFTSFIFCGLPLTTQAGDSNTKIGFVDLQKVVQSTSTGKAAKESLEKEFNKIKKEIDQKEADLTKMKEDLDKKKSAYSEAVFNRKMSEFQQEVMKHQEMLAKNNNEIRKKERDLTQPVIDSILQIVEKKAKDENYSVIFEKQTVLWAKTDLEITDQIVEEYEKNKKEADKKKK